MLQDEETPKEGIKFDGVVTQNNKQRGMAEIYQEYFESYPSCIDRIFTGISRSVVKCDDCKHESVTYKPFSVLPLEVEESLEQSIKQSL